MRDVAAAVRERAAAQGFALDPAQEAALPALVRVALGAPGGTYLCGPPGRGKTWLVDAVLACAAPPGLLRVHHHGLHAAAGPSGAFAQGLPAVLGGVRLLVLDELHLHDSDDAWMAERALRAVLDAGGAVVVTSNHAVDGLHAGSAHAEGVRRLLHERAEVLAVDGGRDHRLDPGAGSDRPRFRSGAFLSPGGGLSLADVGLARPSPGERDVLVVGGRPLPVAAAQEGATVWVPFGSLCEAPVSAADAAELADRFGTWVVVGVPPLGGCLPDVRARFLAAVDVAHDRDVRLVLVARQPLPETVADGDPLPDWPRAVSRLHLLAR